MINKKNFTNSVDSAILTKGRLDIAIVIEKQDENFVGFVPGLIMKNIYNTSLEQCEIDTIAYTKQTIQKMSQENLPMPFFPSNEEINRDFHPFKIIRIVAHINR